MEDMKMSTGRKILCVIDIVIAALSTVVLAFNLSCDFEIIALNSSGETGLGAGIGMAFLVVFAILSLIAVGVLALVDIILFIISRRAQHRVARMISLSTFIYHMCAVTLAIIAYLLVLYANGAVVS